MNGTEKEKKFAVNFLKNILRMGLANDNENSWAKIVNRYIEMLTEKKED